MRVEVTFYERAMIANLLRRRSIELAERARQTAVDRQRVELEEESRAAENLAIRYDDGEELVMEQRSIPKVVNTTRDLDYVNENKN